MKDFKKIAWNYKAYTIFWLINVIISSSVPFISIFIEILILKLYYVFNYSSYQKNWLIWVIY